MIRYLVGLALGRALRKRVGPRSADERMLAFARGLALGALVGAVIAGVGLPKDRTN